VRWNDRARLEAKLSEPAYAYLLGFNPTDKVQDQEQFIPQDEVDRPPEKRQEFTPRNWLRLSDGVGLQAFALVASRQQLPAYSAWRRHRPNLPWKRTRALSGVVWVGDEQAVRGLTGLGSDRAPEEEGAGDGVMVRDLWRTLKELPSIEAVVVVGFAVDRTE
jgi:hypothetical protein